MISWESALDLETKVAAIIFQQEINGIGFDLQSAKKHVNTLELERGKLYDQIRPSLTIEIDLPYKDKPVNRPFLKNGSYNRSVLAWFDDPSIVGGPFTRVEFVEPDIGSRQKLIKQLLNFGWKPTIFTATGQPKLTEKGIPVDSLNDIEGDIGKLIARWYTLGHRQSQIKGWIRDIRPDGRLTAAADSCGTNTVRFRHKIVVNVPKADPNVIFGYEMRDLFIPRPGYFMVGHDASGLEARMMAHYTTPIDGGEFAELILRGDPHSKNARIFYPEETEGLNKGNETFDSYRSKSKNGFYGLIYGAQPPKLASTLGTTVSRGKKLFNSFWEENYALGVLRDKVIRMAEKNGWIIGLDGRKIYTRSTHSALNALFQSAGAIIMKRSMVILDASVREEGIEAIKVADMHDEAQAEVPEDDVVYYEFRTKEETNVFDKDRIGDNIWMKPTMTHEGLWKVGYCRYGELAVKSIVDAGTYYNLRCPLDAEYKIGRSWAETH